MNKTSLQRINDTGGEILKVDIIVGAYSQLRISGITREPTPEDLETALFRLENMAAELNTTSMDGGFNFEDNPDPNSDSGLIRGFAHAYETNLAVRLIPDFNQAVPQSLMTQAAQSMSGMISVIAASRMRKTEYPDRMPIGSGNSYRYSRWAKFYRNVGDAPLSSTTEYLYVGDVQDYIEHFASFLNGTEVISSFSIVVDPGLTVDSSSNTDNDVLYRLSASGDGGVAQVTIVMTSDTGRIETRIHYVEIRSRG